MRRPQTDHPRSSQHRAKLQMSSRKALLLATAMTRSTYVPFSASQRVTRSDSPNLQKDTYEILLGDMNALRWVRTSGKLNVASLGYRPIEGGVDSDGTILYVVRAEHNGCFHPGKASERLKGQYSISLTER